MKLTKVAVMKAHVVEAVPDDDLPPTLEPEEPVTVAQGSATSNGEATETTDQETVPTATSTTTPATGKVKDWDKIVRDFEEEESKNDGVDDLFREIYEKSDENVRRAMNKSFVESQGTVLSTNWNDVEKDKVTVKPPEGTEFKKWE